MHDELAQSRSALAIDAVAASRGATTDVAATVIGLGSVIMLTSWAVFEVWGMVAGLIVGVILLDFGEQGALVSNQHVIYALRPEARNRLNTIFMDGMFVGGAVGSAGASLAWHVAGWAPVCAFGAALVAIALGLHACGRAAEKRGGHHATQRPGV